MKNKTKLSKRIVAFFVFMIFTLNSFAAVVSDNDGAAFITKAEFDNLKNSFQSQIDNYNISIDSKINGAIAQYLAGLQHLTKERVVPIFDTSKVIKCVNKGTLTRTKENRTKFTVTGAQGRDGNVDNQSAAAGFWIENGQGDLWYTMSDKPNVVQRYYKKGFLNATWGYNFVLSQNISLAGSGPEGIMVLRSTETTNRNLKTQTKITISEATFNGSTASPLPWIAKYKNAPWDASTGKETSGTWRDNVNVVVYNLNLESPDDTIYLFTDCDEKYINVVSEADDVVEAYNDVFVDPTDSSKTITKTTEGFYQLQQFKLLVRDESGTTYLASTMFQGKKRRVKQTTAVAKGFTAFNNLNQLKNGSLGYTLAEKIEYPSFYGGLPLFVTGDKIPNKAEFRIKIDGIASKIKLWVKKGEFLNNSNISTWPTADQNDICKISSSGSTPAADKSVLIDKNVDTLVTVEGELEANTPYFLRFCENGSTYGGQLLSLSDINLFIDD